MPVISSTSTSSFYTSAADQLASLQQQASAVSTSISTGSQLASASDNPTA